MVEKKVKGRKRHIVTDIPGHLLFVEVHAANIADTMAGAAMLKRVLEKIPTLKGLCADAGYRGTFVLAAAELGIPVDVVMRIAEKFEILPKRWRVERTFGWMTGSRRLSKDFEIGIDSAKAMIFISHASTLLKRFDDSA